MNRRERTMAMVVGIAAALLALDLLVLSPMDRNAKVGAQIREAREALRVAQERVEMRGEIEAAWNPYAGRLQGLTPDRASSAFDGDLRGCLRSAGIELTSGQTETAPSRGPFHVVTGTFAFTCENDKLWDLMDALERYEGFLRVERLEVLSNWISDQALARAPLRVTLVVSTLGGLKNVR